METETGFPHQSENLLEPAPVEESENLLLGPDDDSSSAVSYGLDNNHSDHDTLGEIDDFQTLAGVTTSGFDVECYEKFMMRYDNIDPTNYVVWDFSEVKKVVEKLVKARAKLFNNMHKSGTHTSQPEGFLDVALKSCDCFKSIGPCGLYYFYWKSKACTDYDSNFSPFLFRI